MEKKFETFYIGNTFVSQSGGGVTAEQILAALRTLYFGGIKITERVGLVKADEGPTRFFNVFRSELGTEYLKTPAREVWEHLKQERDKITYEIALRWFLTSPTYHLYDARNRDFKRTGGRIAVLPPNAIEVDGKPQVLIFAKGDNPLVHMFDAELDLPLPGDFLTTLELK